MNYEEALRYINDQEKFGSNLRLDTIRRLLELLGNPHKDLKYIHIAGTNGKGSTSSYVATMLKEAGYKVGLFTSPYLERFNERIAINGADIPNERLAEITERVKDRIQIMIQEKYEHPTTFEIITAIGFVYFQEEKVDYVVLEVGLGGRLDATNVIDESLLSIITTIDYDHMDVLGNTLGEIAYEKAGIIKERGLVLSYPQKEEAIEVIEKVCEERKAELTICPMENVKIIELNEYGGIFDYHYNNTAFKNLEISLIGEHQVYNAALSVTAILLLREKGLVNITDEQIRSGLKKARWKGRLEVLNRHPLFVIDGAHNPQGVQTLVDNLKRFRYNRLILGIGILKDKEVEKIVEVITPLADEIVITEANIYRKMKAEELEQMINKYNKNTHVEKDIKKAIDKSYELAKEDDLILFMGSLYLIGDVRKIYTENY